VTSQLKAAESRLQRVQTDLFSAQGEVAAGMIVVRRTCHAGLRTCMNALTIIPEVANHLPLCLQEFFISKDLVGVIIGKKGTRIRQIEQDTGVTSINVNGESGQGGAPRRAGCCELNRWCLCVCVCRAHHHLRARLQLGAAGPGDAGAVRGVLRAAAQVRAVAQRKEQLRPARLGRSPYAMHVK
jgi:hypothetical protein